MLDSLRKKALESSDLLSSKLNLLSVVSSHGLMHAYLVILPALIPLAKVDIGDIQTFGLLASIVFLFYGWGSIPVGFISDRYSKRILITTSMILCGLSSILVGFSQSIWLMAFSFVLLGFGTSLYHPPGYTLVNSISLKMKGRYIGIQGLGGEIGMAIAYFTSPVVGLLYGWRIAFIIWGILGLIMGVFDFFFIKDEQKQDNIQNLSKSDPGIPKLKIKIIFSKENLRILVAVVVIIICSGALWNGVSSFLLTYVNETKGLQLVIAGGLSTISYTIGGFAQLIGGELSDKFDRKIILGVGFLTFSVFLILFTIIPGSFFLVLLMISMLGFTFYLTQSPLNALLGDVSPQRTVGLTYGFNFAIKYGIGGFSPAIAGFLAENYSLNHVFYFFALLSIIAFFFSLLMKKSTSKK